jgi:hypothetical protein
MNILELTDENGQQELKLVFAHELDRIDGAQIEAPV